MGVIESCLECLNSELRGNGGGSLVETSGQALCLVSPIIIIRLCGLVVRVPGYRSRGLGFDSRRYQIF
jgi:hypothetical protein